jgi:hypothetical protein
MIKSISIIGSILLCACTRLENSVEQVSLTCGENAGEGKRLIQLAGWDEDTFLAVAIPLDASGELPVYSQRFTPRVTSKRCVEVDKNFTGILAVKNNTRGESFTINSADLSLTQRNSLPLPINVDIKVCPSEKSYTKNAIILQNRNQNLASPALPFYSLEILDPLGNLRSDIKNQATIKIDFVSEGLHKITIHTLDAFNTDSAKPISSDACQITYDIKVPTISSDIDRFPRSKETGVVLLPQENSFKLSGTDDNDLQFFSCLKKRSFPSIIEPCGNTDFHVNNPIIQAPESGVWDIQAFTQDSAGNQSEILKISFAVYHDKDLSKMEGIEKKINEYLRQSKFTEAGNALRDGLTAYKNFELTDEKKFIESRLLSATADVQLLSTVSSHKEWRSYSGVITRSPLGQHFALHGYSDLTIWDRKLNRLLTRSNVAGFVWFSESAMILDRDGNLYRYRPDQDLRLIGTVSGVAFASDMRRKIQIVPDPKNSNRFVLRDLLGFKVYEIDQDQNLQLLWRWDVMDLDSEVQFSPVSDSLAFRIETTFFVMNLKTKEVKYPQISATGEACQTRSFQFLRTGVIVISNQDADPEKSCPPLALISEINGQFISEKFLDKFNLTNGFQGPVDLKASYSGDNSILLAYQKDNSRALQYFSFSSASDLNLLSTGILETESAEPIQNIDLDPTTRMIMLSKSSTFGYLAWDDSFRLPGNALWVPRFEPFSAPLSNPSQIVQIDNNSITLHDIGQGFLGTQYMPSGEFLSRYVANPSIQFTTMTPAIDDSSGHVLTFDIPTLKLRVSDRNLRPIQELNLNFIPTALDAYKGEFYIAAADGKIYQYRIDLGNVVEIADFKAPVIQFEKFDEGLIAKVADIDGKNYNISKILQGQSIQAVWKRVGSGTFFSTADRRLYHVNFGNRYVFKAPGFEKIFSSNLGMTKQTLLERKSGDLYLLTDTVLVKYSKSNNYAEPGLRLSGGDSIYASSIGLLKLANKKLSVLPESTDYNEGLLEDIEQVRTIDETHILVERTDGKVFVYNYRERKIAFFLEALTSGLKGVRCFPLGSSFLLDREMTSSISRIDRVPLNLTEAFPSLP